MAGGNSMTDSLVTHGSVTQRRALAALILAESERNGAGYGTRLPTERQLAVDLGVSRSAESGLAEAGLGESGDYAPADVMAVRRLFEPTAMSLVVAWATARDFAEMDRCLRGGERAADHDEFEVWDAALHRSIIAATRSPLLIRLYAY